MRATQAAKIIGCTPQQVRYLARTKQLRATRRLMPGGYYWEIREEAVRDYAAKPQSRGYPRGQARK